MTVHLLKLAVGVDDLDHLRTLQAGRPGIRAGRRLVSGFTRRKPRRVVELLDGGSIYWVIKGKIAARQQLLGFEDDIDQDGVPYCRLLLDPVLVATCMLPRRAFQGWRYLAPVDAPPDAGAESRVGTDNDDALPPHMARDLRDIGLL